MALNAVLIAPDGQRLERYRQLIVSAEKGVEVVAMADSLAKGKEEIYRSIPDMVLIDHEQALDFIARLTIESLSLIHISEPTRQSLVGCGV